MLILHGLFILRSKYLRHTGQLCIIRNSQGSVGLGKDQFRMLFMHLATMEFTIVPSIHTVVCLTGEASAASMAGKSIYSVCEPPAAYNNCQRHSWP